MTQGGLSLVQYCREAKGKEGWGVRLVQYLEQGAPLQTQIPRGASEWEGAGLLGSRRLFRRDGFLPPQE